MVDKKLKYSPTATITPGQQGLNNYKILLVTVVFGRCVMLIVCFAIPHVLFPVGTVAPRVIIFSGA